MHINGSAFHPNVSMLPLPQQRLWAELGSTPPNFVLYGGTALALRLGHRVSVDFDFFSSLPFVPSELQSALPYLSGAIVIQSSANTLTCRVERDGPVLLSYFGGLPIRQVHRPDHVPMGIKIASLLDLAATKVKVVLDRASQKDYLDIDAILQAGISLPQALLAARAVYGDVYNPLLTLKALTYFGDGDVAQLPDAMKGRLTDAVRMLNLSEVLRTQVPPAVTPIGRV